MKHRGKRLAAALLALALCVPIAGTALAADARGGVRISELMYKNHATLQDADGDFSDWFELENTSGRAVSLRGWSASDGKTVWDFPDVTLARGERRVVFASGKDRSGSELHTSFALGEGETLYLLAPDGTITDRLDCEGIEADHVLRREDGKTAEAVESVWATPGYPNDAAGYEAFCATRLIESPLVIYEVMVCNDAYPDASTGEYYDWVELKNVSDEPVELSDYCLSDDRRALDQWTLPAVTLAPGKTCVVFCTGDEALSAKRKNAAPFALGADSETLYLTKAGESAAADFVWLHDLPANRSYGRMKGENGFFYLWQPTPGAENSGDAYRYVSDTPAAVTAPGVYDGVDEVLIELSAAGDIYYTTDGSAPTADSTPYTGAIAAGKTTVLRAVSVEADAAPSRAVTFGYFVNEEHTLPVLSLVTDAPRDFRSMYNSAQKDRTLAANLSLYAPEGSFSADCGVELKGFTSLSSPKKSLGVKFRARYGSETLRCDIFGGGVTEFSSLSIRAGQDYPVTVFRSELMQELCLDAGERTPTQRSRYCALYINGQYWGIYCLKDDLTRAYYAERTGTSADNVEMLSSPVSVTSSVYQEALAYKDSSLPAGEAYERFCEVFDIDSMVDWFLLEGYCCNTDLKSNLRYFKAGDGKWQVAFYDLDWAFYYAGNCFYNLYGENFRAQILQLVRWLLQSEDFRERALTRYAELLQTTLSNEHVLARIDAFQALLEPEMARERERWDGSDVRTWNEEVDRLRAFFTENDYERFSAEQLCRALGVTEAERKEYFGF